ncbi:sulfate ABC transporter substrate-binding protein [Paenibacillus sp. IB182496]|uniref:Sulfate-binding protein n=1 Tax=Paenibacillus sabuli TaxID=2772509 RepID=A0A927BUP8_9BACL|nr:sulfate ABC transporter substrate-binding protein [Paenibacillus sabuli]MBD2845723.1 sulfate ABC transporter substrate-binding protein [Paenibacillus sabuli]
MKSSNRVRLFVVLVTLSLMLAVAACGSGSNGNSSSSGNTGGAPDNDGVEAAGSNTGAQNEEVADTKEPKPPVQLLNVSYDPTRELYAEFNVAFAKHWKEETGQEVTIDQSHGGSGSQGRSVIDGIKADVVTLALGYDIEAIADAGIIDKGWQEEFERNSAPYTSTIVFLVRDGNPKNIQDWDDLIKEDVEVITPNPKTSGGARWNYLAAWGYALKQNGNDEEKAKEFVGKLFQNVPVLDSGARGSTTTFVEREIGDVLLAWENEALLSLEEFGEGKFEIVTPSVSILAEPPVAIVDKSVESRGTREVAEAYLEYLYSEEGQDIAGRNFYRPTLPEVAEKYKDQYQDIEMFEINRDFGGWVKAQEKHFNDGGIFDQIYVPGA